MMKKIFLIFAIALKESYNHFMYIFIIYSLGYIILEIINL